MKPGRGRWFRPGVVWLVVLLLDVLAAIAVTGLSFDDGLGRVFASDDARNRDYSAIAGQFTASEGDTVVLFESPDFAVPDNLQAVSDFVIEASFLSPVTDVFSVFSLREPTEGGAGAPLISFDVPQDGDLARTLDALARDGGEGGRLVSADRTLTAVVIATDSSVAEHGARGVLDDIAALAAGMTAQTGVSYVITGLPAIRLDIVDSLFTDLIRLNSLGMIAGFGICILALRSVRLAFLVTLPAGTALLWALGALSAFGFGINVLSIALPVLILVLSFADSLHLAFDVRRLVPSIRAPDTLAISALRRVGPACALASLTTAIAFAGLLISDSEIVRDFGVAGVVAAPVALIAVLIVQPLVFATAGRLVTPEKLFPQPRARGFRIFDWGFLPEFALRHPRSIAVTAVAALVVLGAIYTAIEPSYSVLENIDRNADRVQAIETMNAELAPINSIDIPVAIGADGIDGDALTDIAATHEAVAGLVPGTVAVSLHSLVPDAPGRGAGDRAAEAAALLATMSASQRGRFISEDGDTALVRLHIDTYDAGEIRAITGRIEAALAADPVAAAAAGTPTGFMVMSSFVSAGMILDLNYCFFIAVVASGLLTTLWFVNWRYGAVALIPNVLPILAVGAWLVLSGNGLQFSSGIALTIAFGIAVDDTVHIINRLKLNAPKGRPFDRDAIHRSVLEVTPALVVTTAVLSFGLLSTFSSASPMIGYFGILSIAVFILAILADLVVLPACLMVLNRTEEKRRGKRRALQRGNA